jgi:hypothetical protein
MKMTSPNRWNLKINPPADWQQKSAAPKYGRCAFCLAADLERHPMPRTKTSWAQKTPTAQARECCLRKTQAAEREAQVGES